MCTHEQASSARAKHTVTHLRTQGTDDDSSTHTHTFTHNLCGKMLQRMLEYPSVPSHARTLFLPQHTVCTDAQMYPPSHPRTHAHTQPRAHLLQHVLERGHHAPRRRECLTPRGTALWRASHALHGHACLQHALHALAARDAHACQAGPPPAGLLVQGLGAGADPGTGRAEGPQSLAQRAGQGLDVKQCRGRAGWRGTHREPVGAGPGCWVSGGEASGCESARAGPGC